MITVNSYVNMIDRSLFIIDWFKNNLAAKEETKGKPSLVKVVEINTPVSHSCLCLEQPSRKIYAWEFKIIVVKQLVTLLNISHIKHAGSRPTINFHKDKQRKRANCTFQPIQQRKTEIYRLLIVILHKKC